MLNLPSSVLANIFSFLSPQDMSSFALTNTKIGKSCIKEDIQRHVLRNKLLSYFPYLDRHKIEAMKEVKELKTLFQEEKSYWEKTLSSFTNPFTLVYPNLPVSFTNGEHINNLDKFKNPQEIRFYKYNNLEMVRLALYGGEGLSNLPWGEYQPEQKEGESFSALYEVREFFEKLCAITLANSEHFEFIKKEKVNYANRGEGMAYFFKVKDHVYILQERFIDDLFTFAIKFNNVLCIETFFENEQLKKCLHNYNYFLNDAIRYNHVEIIKLIREKAAAELTTKEKLNADLYIAELEYIRLVVEDLPNPFQSNQTLTFSDNKKKRVFAKIEDPSDIKPTVEKKIKTDEEIQEANVSSPSKQEEKKPLCTIF